ncbi:transmembrane protein 107-like [Sycon ciliatum]|uniref:transmembrane protein 107-like n=1 Tax=Sycon ciliatum TaxID=27933 RepID=UPI0020AD6783|eukprot:scpid107222/ scgid4525/ Transmembrane protein 107
MARPLRTIVPARFLALSAHLAVVIMSFYARDGNIKECLPLQYTASEYNSKDDRLIVGLSFSLGFLAIEFFGFLFGFTMFNSAISLVSIGLHISGAVSMLFFRINTWDCDRFWPIFGVCSALPAVLEAIVIIYTAKYRR